MPKQCRGTYADIHQWDNLYRAYRNAAKGKRSRQTAAAFEYRLEDNLIALRNELADESYQPSGYSHFTIHEPKRRLISAADFQDRVVHHALCNIIMPPFEQSFIHHSYANRVGKGTHRALDTCQQWAKEYGYVLQLDIKQFFPAIDHTILKRILFRRIQDGATRTLIKKILVSGIGVLSESYDMVYFGGDNLLAATRPRGLPIGNLSSQFWANCYMNEFDYFVTRDLECPAYLRYVDDFCLFSDDFQQLQRWRNAIIGKLSDYRLTIHSQRAFVRKTTHGIPFLGFVVYPTHRLLKRRKGIHYRRHLRNLLQRYHEQDVDRAEIQNSVQGWINHARYGDTWGLRRTIVNEVRL